MRERVSCDAFGTQIKKKSWGHFGLYQFWRATHTFIEIYMKRAVPNVKSVADPGFHRRGNQPHRWGLQPISLVIFVPRTAWNWKKIVVYREWGTYPQHPSCDMLSGTIKDDFYELCCYWVTENKSKKFISF